ncbi:MAG: hypothetical protein OEQ39_03020 [Gammaproteobacteria bacterium]|nr:hypothetical protein [Gammaproteobacteria bacterium]MDH3375922.1 hypothetical protein [Gammaproteobacteria bacterium]
MALTAIQTEKWRQQMEAFLTTQTVAANILDRAVPIEGSDTFHIINPTDVTTATTDDASDITYAAQTDTNVSVSKNFDKYFALLILDTNKMQTTLQGWERAYAENGAYQLAQDLDSAVFSDHANWTDFQNAGADWQFESDAGATRLWQINHMFGSLMQQMRTNKVDNKGTPFLVVNPELANYIEQFTANRQTQLGDNITFAGGGRRFKYMGFNVYVSNNLTTVSTTLHCMGGIEGYGNALGIYALPKTFEVQRAEGRFGDIIRGRVAAGYKVVRTVAVYDVMVNTTMTGT